LFYWQAGSYLLARFCPATRQVCLRSAQQGWLSLL